MKSGTDGRLRRWGHSGGPPEITGGPPVPPNRLRLRRAGYLAGLNLGTKISRSFAGWFRARLKKASTLNTYSAATGAPLAATERSIKNTRSTSATEMAAKTTNESK
jgi:hypothetical protein